MTTEVIAAIFAGLVITIPLVFKGLSELMTKLKGIIEAVQAANRKLDAVVIQGDGMRTELLERVAAVELMLSKVSGNTIRADNAQQAATDHREAAAAAKEIKETP